MSLIKGFETCSKQIHSCTGILQRPGERLQRVSQSISEQFLLFAREVYPAKSLHRHQEILLPRRGINVLQKTSKWPKRYPEHHTTPACLPLTVHPAALCKDNTDTGCPHVAKENRIHQTMPSSSSAPWC